MSDEASLAALHDDLQAVLILGWLAPAAKSLVETLDLTTDAAAVLGRHEARSRADRCGAAALEALTWRLNDVADAVARCVGPREACTDPSANPALARALWAAREAGADDVTLRQALEDGFEAAPRVSAAAPPTRSYTVASGGDLTSDSVVRALRLDPRLIASDDSEPVAAALRKPRLYVDVSAQLTGEGAGLNSGEDEALTGLLRLAAVAAAAAGASVALAGLRETLVRRAMPHDSAEACAFVADLTRRAHAAAATLGDAAPAVVVMVDAEASASGWAACRPACRRGPGR